MKFSIFFLSAIFALTYALPPPLHDDGKIHIPEKCSDVLAVKVCENLKALALRLKLKAEDVTRAVVTAVKQGKTTSIEIYNAAKDFLVSQVLTKKCEDFTTAENCEKLRKVAALLKIKAEKVEEYVIKALAEGAVQAKDIYAKAMEYYKAEIATKKCEDFLTADQCTKLRSIAAKLKIKVDDLEDAIKKAYLEALGDAKEMFAKVIATLKDYALNTKCEDLLNPDLCAALRRYAEMTKVQLPVLIEKAVDLLITGYDVSKTLLTKIYQLVDTFYDCTDVFDQSSCDKLYKMAEFLGLAHQKVEEFLKKYIPIAVETGKDLINDFPSMIKDLATFLKDQWCQITPFCISSDQAPSFDKMMFSNDLNFDFDAIKENIKKYIEEKYPKMKEQVKQKITEIINKATSITGLVKDAAIEILLVGGDIQEEVTAILKDLISNIKNIVYPTPSNDVAFLANDIVDIDAIKKLLNDFIETTYPALEEKVKQQVLDVINKAKSITDLLAKAAKEIFLASGEAAGKIKAIFMELINKVKNEFVFDEMMYKRDLDFEQTKQKVIEYIKQKYAAVPEEIKQKVSEMITKAKSVLDLLVNAAKEIYNATGDHADQLKKMLNDLIQKITA